LVSTRGKSLPLDLEKETSEDEFVEEGERQEKYDAFELDN
jgi:hypothetical protein